MKIAKYDNNNKMNFKEDLLNIRKILIKKERKKENCRKIFCRFR